MKTEFKVGQKCKSVQLGECEVVSINIERDHPLICINKKGYSKTYTLDGKYISQDTFQSLYPAESFPFEPFEERMMEVRDTDCDKWKQRKAIGVIKGFFICENDNGRPFLPIAYRYAREPQVTEPSQEEIKNQIIELGNKMSELTKKLK